MENQHRQIKGYGEFSKEEIAMINEAKTLAQQVGAFIERIEQADGLVKQLAKSGGSPRLDTPPALEDLVGHMQTGAVVVDMRWLAIAKTDLQKAHMMLVRAIARPTTF